ncbi:MAG TPA: ubiquinone-binding protein [Alphaproteobacteria bacterium]|nr:ubiquinone-binding protein [Alphaproteobacteria bacterium]HAJ45414.1 ubiquinone-binding protein [Alphaproteobacteria bacterium]
MPQHSERRIVPYPAQQMFGLIADIERYPEFLPWCANAKLGEPQTIDGITVVNAELTVVFAAIREPYTSRVTIDPAQSLIEAVHVKGPFSHLNTRWRITPRGPGASLIECNVDFSLKSRSLQAVMTMVFGSAVARMANAFEQRARVLFGRSVDAVRSDEWR